MELMLLDYLFYQIVLLKKMFNGLRGIVSSYKLSKIMDLNTKILQEIKKDHKHDTDQEIEKYTNKFLKVTENLENFSYNKIILICTRYILF